MEEAERTLAERAERVALQGPAGRAPRTRGVGGPRGSRGRRRRRREEAGEEVGGVDAGQPDEEAPDRLVAALEERDDPQNRDQQVGDAHTRARPGVRAEEPYH